MKLTNISGKVEEKREPTDPVEELSIAHLANLGREPFEGIKDLSKE